jgi:hypothetical protein
MTLATLVVILGLALGDASTQQPCADAAGGVCPDNADVSALLQRNTAIQHEAVELEGEETPEVVVIPGHQVSLRPKSEVDPAFQPLKSVSMESLLQITGHEGQGGQALNDDETSLVKSILKHVANASNDTNASKALDDINQGNASDKIKGSDNAAVIKALEEESEDTSPEDEFNRTGTVITSKLLQKLNGEDTNPEEAANNSNVVEGDELAKNSSDALLLLQFAAEGKRMVNNLWTDKMNIPFCFSQTIAPSSKTAFLAAVQHFKDHIPCVGFKQVAVEDESKKMCTSKPGIFVFSSDNGCFANVGQPGKNWVAPDYETQEWDSTVCHLQPNGCDTMGIAAHEIGHNLGMLHEQSRTDHNQYIKILWDNIEAKNKNQYDLSSDADTTTPYDPMSLMHYGDTDFGKKDANGNSMKTMEFKGSSNKPMGNRQGLTNADVQQVAKMYGCTDTVQQFKLCTEKADGCSPSDCICHQSSGLKKIKGPQDNCYQCAKQCPPASGGSGTSGYCGCGTGQVKDCWNDGGKKYCMCKKAPDPNCKDSTTFKDGLYGDSCAGWVGFSCSGQGMTSAQETALQTNCPKACKKCGQ